MRSFLKIFFLLFSGFAFLTGQSPSDFQVRVENSFLKLYENPDVAIHAANEIRSEKDQLDVNDILTKAYLLKGDYLESVRVAFETDDLKNTGKNLMRSLIMAREFYQLNLYEQSAKILSPLLNGKITANESNKDHFLYAMLYQLEAKNSIAFKKIDDAQNSLKKSSEFAKNAGNSSDLMIKENLLLAAVIQAEKGDQNKAWKMTDQLLTDLKKTPRAVYLRSLTQQFRGKLFFKEQNYTESIKCLEDALSMVDKIPYDPLKKSLYEDLSQNYLVLKQTRQYEIYKKRSFDSSTVLEEKKKLARRELVSLNTELTVANTKLVTTKRKTQYFSVLAISLLLLLAGGYFLIREIQKSKSLAKQIKFFRSINFPQELKKEPVKEKDASKKPLLIPKETEEEILALLDKFEESKKYLDNSMSLATLSAQLGTNTKYLSEIINKYKDKNFNTYINELRIKHVINLLSTDRTYLQYKISYIAEIGGFTSHSAFTNVFKTITGMSPQEYLQTLRNNES